MPICKVGITTPALTRAGTMPGHPVPTQSLTALSGEDVVWSRATRILPFAEEAVSDHMDHTRYPGAALIWQPGIWAQGFPPPAGLLGGILSGKTFVLLFLYPPLSLPVYPISPALHPTAPPLCLLPTLSFSVSSLSVFCLLPQALPCLLLSWSLLTNSFCPFILGEI